METAWLGPSWSDMLVSAPLERIRVVSKQPLAKDHYDRCDRFVSLKTSGWWHRQWMRCKATFSQPSCWWLALAGRWPCEAPLAIGKSTATAQSHFTFLTTAKWRRCNYRHVNSLQDALKVFIFLHLFSLYSKISRNIYTVFSNIFPWNIPSSKQHKCNLKLSENRYDKNWQTN